MLIQLPELRAECARDPLIRTIVSACARNRQSALMRLTWCQRHLEPQPGMPLRSRSGSLTAERFKELILAFRALERTGFGQLLQPRQVERARFRWAVMPLVLERLLRQPEAELRPGDLLPAAADLGLELPPPVAVQAVAVGRAAWMRHEVTLRPREAAELYVPEDLTAEEAEWLGAFLRRLAKPPGKAGAPPPQESGQPD